MKLLGLRSRLRLLRPGSEVPRSWPGPAPASGALSRTAMQLANHDWTDQIMKIYCLLVERAPATARAHTRR
jgi:hypothetical protein